MKSMNWPMHACIAAVALSSGMAYAQNASKADSITPIVYETETGDVVVRGKTFSSWGAYFASADFDAIAGRCHTVDPDGLDEIELLFGSTSDCTLNSTNPTAAYDPSVVKYRIPVVVHVIRTTAGTTGNISTAMVQSQIDVLNEDFNAIAGTLGAPGTDVQIEFQLAQTDPTGNPTNGITYSNNTTWYNDGGSYWNSLAWDPDKYLNIYTNSAAGALGYVPGLPQEGVAGSNADRVVILWSAFGRNSPAVPYNLGRTATHEVGHYLGLFHTFNSCGSSTPCYTTGDRICDTVRQSSPTGGCSNGNSCGDGNNRRNYMDYSDDSCMWEFTPDQARRMRCTLENWRPQLWEFAGDPTGRCCMPDGSCAIDTNAGCLAMGGAYSGDFTNCTSSCPAPTGACCVPGNGCFELSVVNCGFAGGTFMGLGESCSANPCEAPTGGCCFSDGSCSDIEASACASGGGTYQGDGAMCA
ncbi:MAG: zinc metalloprotease, partial [Phycisphaerales bacterium]|nr:zinc metalloprotease [Phycisphaerales bacterium]